MTLKRKIQLQNHTKRKNEGKKMLVCEKRTVTNKIDGFKCKNSNQTSVKIRQMEKNKSCYAQNETKKRK